MTVGTPQQTNFQSDSGTVYKTGIDNNFKIMLAREAQFAPHEQTSPVMTVRVEAGTISAYDGTNTTYAAQSTGTITAPVSNSRIDVVVLNPSSGALTVITGTPGASPAVPAISNDRIPLCQILLTSLSAAITNLMITDMRPTCGFFNNLRIPGTLNVQGAVTFASTLNVTGIATLSSNATVGGTLGVTGSFTLNGGGTIQGGVIDNSSIGATTRSTGAFTTLAANGAVTLTSTLSVGSPSGSPSTGDVNISGSYKVNGVALVLGTLNTPGGVATTSGTSIDFTGLPAAIKRISIVFGGVSTTGTSVVIVQLRASGSPVTSGYLGAATGGGGAVSSFTTGCAVSGSNAAVDTRNGIIAFCNISGNIWAGSGSIVLGNAALVSPTGTVVTLGATLDGIRLTTVAGTDTFDAGNVNIFYEF